MTTTFSGPVASQAGFVTASYESTALPYYTTGNIIYVIDLNTLAFGGEDQWYRQDTGAGLGTGGQGGGGAGTVKTFKWYMSGSTADYTYFMAQPTGGVGPGMSGITFNNLDSYPDTKAFLQTIPVGAVITVNEGTGGAGGIAPGSTFVVTAPLTGGAGTYSFQTTTSASFMSGMTDIYYLTIAY